MSGKEYGYSSREETLRHVHSQSARRGAPVKTPRRNGVRANEGFGSRQIDVKRYILAPEGWEGFVFPLYFLLIPYLTGMLFIFLFVARSDIDNFLVLDFTAFFVLWAIGYEINAVLIIAALVFSYFRWKLSYKQHKKSAR